MTIEQKIDYMIQSLQLVKEEITYAKWYTEGKEKDRNFDWYDHPGYQKRSPNGTIIRESLKMVGRMANIMANSICLSPYNKNLYKE